MQECLEDHLDEPKFASDCKEELDAVIARRVADFRLNTVLRDACAGDLQEHCAATLQVSNICESYLCSLQQHIIPGRKVRW